MERVALITAGGSGMGADSARALAADGCKVGILSSSGKGEALAEELGGVGITGTNKSEEDLQKLVDAAMSHWGRIDVLENSARHGPRAPVLELTDADWYEGMEVYFLNAGRPSRLVTPTIQNRVAARSSTSRPSRHLSPSQSSQLLAYRVQVLQHFQSSLPTSMQSRTSA